MEFQMLVGLLCVRHDPDAMRIVVGDMVDDEATGTARDVDVTVEVQCKSGNGVFAAYDVKQHSRPLDAGQVDGLIRKLQDMPTFQERAIVSASGFTAPALSKIGHHGLSAYQFREWSQPDDFDPHGPGMRKGHVEGRDLRWLQCKASVNPMDRNREGLAFDRPSEVRVYSDQDLSDDEYHTLDQTIEDVARRALDDLRSRDELQELLLSLLNNADSPERGASEPANVKVIVDVESPMFIRRHGEAHRITEVLLLGQVVWERQVLRSVQYEMVNCRTEEVFGQATIGKVDDDLLLACICSPHDTLVEVRQIRLSAKHKSQIQHLALVAR